MIRVFDSPPSALRIGLTLLNALCSLCVLLVVQGGRSCSPCHSRSIPTWKRLERCTGRKNDDDDTPNHHSPNARLSPVSVGLLLCLIIYLVLPCLVFPSLTSRSSDPRAIRRTLLGAALPPYFCGWLFSFRSCVRATVIAQNATLRIFASPLCVRRCNPSLAYSRRNLSSRTSCSGSTSMCSRR